jgi:hypothetical protein
LGEKKKKKKKKPSSGEQGFFFSYFDVAELAIVHIEV